MPRFPLPRIALALAAAGVVLFALSGIGQDDGYWEDGPGWVGAVGWFGFLICCLGLVTTGLLAIVGFFHDQGNRLTH